MNMFNTNSTTVMHSKLLLGLGIDPRTADLILHDEERDIPLWSMMRLIDMIPGFIVDDDGYTYSFTISKGTYVYNLSYTRKTKHGEKTLISFHNPVDSFGETVILIKEFDCAISIKKDILICLSMLNEISMSEDDLEKKFETDINLN